MNYYKEANKLEDKINSLLKINPIKPNNALQWLNFAKTVKTTMTLIEEKTKEILNVQTERKAGWIK